MIALPSDLEHKITWCERLLQELDRELIAFAATSSVEPEAYVDNYLEIPDTADGRKWWHLRMRIKEQPDPHLALLAGDFVQNLRGALDYLAHALVKTTGGSASSGMGGTTFPILKKRKTTLPSLKGCSSEAVSKIVDQFQPYQLDDPSKHPLSLLNELNNMYKHRSIKLVVGLAGFPANYALIDTSTKPFEGVVQPVLRHMTDMDRLDPVMYPFRPGIVPTVIGDFTVVTTLHPSVHPLASVVEDLDYYLRYVRDYLIPSFKPFFDEPWPEEYFKLSSEVPRPYKRKLPTVDEIVDSASKFFLMVTQGDPEEHNVIIMELVPGLTVGPAFD